MVERSPCLAPLIANDNDALLTCVGRDSCVVERSPCLAQR